MIDWLQRIREREKLEMNNWNNRILIYLNGNNFGKNRLKEKDQVISFRHAKLEMPIRNLSGIGSWIYWSKV